jgi:hypothetical protein
MCHQGTWRDLMGGSDQWEPTPAMAELRAGAGVVAQKRQGAHRIHRAGRAPTPELC